MDARLAACLLFSFCSSVLAQGFDHSHKAWDALLKKHVRLVQDGKASQLRYAEMAKERASLKAYLGSLSAVREPEFNAWSRQQRMAFLINAYNAFTVEKVLTRYPDLRSIWDFGKLFGNPFKDEFFLLFGRGFTLDGIEHETLRKRGAYDEPRLHFALNCAAIGCPMLREEAYRADRLDAQLEEQTRRFLSDRTRNRLTGGRLEVSRIFDWYKDDFAPREAFFARHAALLTDDPGQRWLLAEGRVSMAFLDYDWALNDLRP